MNGFTQKTEMADKAIEDSGSSFAVRKGNLKTISDLFTELNAILFRQTNSRTAFLKSILTVNNYRIIRRIKKFGVRHRKVPVTQTIQSDATPDKQTSS